jgi:hypothetical protein
MGSFHSHKNASFFIRGIFFLSFFSQYFIQHCFICRTSESTVSENAGIEPRIVATTALAVRRSYTTRLNLIHKSRFEYLALSSRLFQVGYLGDSDRPACLSKTGRPCDFSAPNNSDRCKLVSNQGYTYNIFQAG